MDFLILCGVTIITVTIILIFRQQKSDFALPLTILFCLILLRQALAVAQNELTFLKSLFENQDMLKYGDIIFKIFGISLLVELLSDVCRDAGENSVASKIELIGKIEIIVISLPLVKKILNIIESIML